MINKLIKEFKDTLRDFGLEGLNKYYGNYRGFVYNNNDPEKCGRIQLIVPQIYGEEPHEYWAWSKGMPAGNGMGLFLLPKKGDMVWVEFEMGDTRYPIWNYGHFNKVNNAPATSSTVNSVFQTKSGHRIELDDTSGGQEIRITDASGNQQIKIDKDGVSILAKGYVELKANGSELHIDDGGVTIDSGAGSIFLNGPNSIVTVAPNTTVVNDVAQLIVSTKVKAG